MKNSNVLTKTALVTVLVLSVLVARPDTAPVTPATKAGVRKTISSYFQFPAFIFPHQALHKEKSRQVQVLFTTGKNGEVNLVIAKTEDPDLKREIERQFRELRFQSLSENVVNSVTLDFQFY